MPLYFDINFLKGAAVYGDDFVHTTVFCLNFKMTKSKVRQLILVAGGNIKEMSQDILQRRMVIWSA